MNMERSRAANFSEEYTTIRLNTYEPSKSNNIVSPCSMKVSLQEEDLN